MEIISNKQKRWLTFSHFLLPLIWMGVIFFLSSQPILPSLEIEWQDFVLKKMAHMVVYMILFWSWFLALQLSVKNPEETYSQLALIIFFCLLFAVSDEWHQSFVPGRTGTLRDIGFDALGVFLASLWSYRLI